MIDTVLFDFGNTLVEYYERSEYPAILEQALHKVRTLLDGKGLLSVSPEAAWQRAQDENYESDDHRVRPLEERLGRIFQLDGLDQTADFTLDMCRHFLKPVFARGRRYEDTLLTLQELRARGFRVAIVTNTPWGSPGDLWREEVERFGLGDYVDAIVCCTDLGWRKPARQIFEYTLEKLPARPQQCIFIGDHLRWDVEGSRAVGMTAVLIDRRGATPAVGETPMRDLRELWNRLKEDTQ